MTKLEKEIDVSRNPSDYSKTTHLIQRIKDPDRVFLEDDVVETVIEDGEVVKVDSNEGGSDKCVTLRGDWCLSTFEVKVCPKDRVVQTAYEVES